MTLSRSADSMKCFDALLVGERAYTIYSLKAAEKTLGALDHLPGCMRILLENLIRHENGKTVTIEDMRTVAAFHAIQKNAPMISVHPARILMHDEDAVSALTDIALMRQTMETLGDDPSLVTPDCPLDIVVDHTAAPYAAHTERFEIMRWAEVSLPFTRVIPPGHGIGNQINLDFLTDVIRTTHAEGSEAALAVPDIVLGADRRHSIIGAAGVLGWTTDVLDLESALMGESVPLVLPGALGVKLTGKLRKGSSITDIALGLSKLVREAGPGGKIVEFFGPGLDHLSVPDRAVIASFLSETGCLCAYFPIDTATITHMQTTGKTPEQIALTEAYAKAQGLWRESWPHDAKQDPTFTSMIEVALDSLRAVVAGPNSLELLAPVASVAEAFATRFPAPPQAATPLAPVKHGDIVSATITSCGNTGHLNEMVIAALLARKAKAAGLTVKPWVKTALTLPNPVLEQVLQSTGLLNDLEAIGFHLSGKDCSTCLACSPLQETVAQAVAKDKIAVCSVSSSLRSGNEPPNPLCAAHYVCPPVLVVAFALAGSIQLDIATKPLATTPDGRGLTLKDLMPSQADIEALGLTPATFAPLYTQALSMIFKGPPEWEKLDHAPSPLFAWREKAMFVRKPPTLDGFALKLSPVKDIVRARVLGVIGDALPAHLIAPDGAVQAQSPAGQYLISLGVPSTNLGVFGSYTGNAEVMTRGALSLVTSDIPLPGPNFYDSAQILRHAGAPIIFATAKDFGKGNGQEWAAKALRFMGVSVIIAESYEPSFRLNLIRMGILPLQIKEGLGLSDLSLSGQETINISGLSIIEHLPAEVMITIEHPSGVERFMLLCRFESDEELELWRSGSLLAQTVRKLIPLAI